MGTMQILIRAVCGVVECYIKCTYNAFLIYWLQLASHMIWCSYFANNRLSPSRQEVVEDNGGTYDSRYSTLSFQNTLNRKHT